MKREVCAVVTKGTLTEGEMLSANPDASYLMAVTETSQNLANKNAERVFGVCVVDTSRVILGQVGPYYVTSSLCVFKFMYGSVSDYCYPVPVSR